MSFRNFITAVMCILLASASAQAGVITIRPILSVSTEYWDNSELSTTRKREDVNTIISPGISISIAEKHTGVGLSYTPGHVAYNKSEQESTWRHNATMTLWRDLGKYTRLQVGDNYMRTDRPVLEADYDLLGYIQVEDQLFPVVDTTIRLVRKEYFTNAATASVTHRFGEGDSISVSYLYGIRKELEMENGNDNSRQAPAISLSYQFTPLFNLDASLTYTRAVFDNSSDYDDWSGGITLNRRLTRHLRMYLAYNHTLNRAEDGGGFDRYAPSVGLSYQIEKDISTSIGAGYFYQDRQDADVEQGLFLDGSIKKSWSYPRGSASLSGRAGLDSNDFGTEKLGFERYYALGWNAAYSLTKRLSTSLSASVRRNEYLDTPGGRKDNRGQAVYRLSFSPISGWFTISSSYTYYIVRSSVKEYEYDNSVVQINASISPTWVFRYVY